MGAVAPKNRQVCYDSNWVDFHKPTINQFSWTCPFIEFNPCRTKKKIEKVGKVSFIPLSEIWPSKLQNATISLVMSVRPSVRREQLGSHWTDFHEI